MTLRVFYSCALCGIQKAALFVEERSQGKNVVEWLEVEVITAIGRDHRARSPYCTAESISEVYIPTSGSDRIGEAAKQ